MQSLINMKQRMDVNHQAEKNMDRDQATRIIPFARTPTIRGRIRHLGEATVI